MAELQIGQLGGASERPSGAAPGSKLACGSMVERSAVNREAGGSSPPRSASFARRDASEASRTPNPTDQVRLLAAVPKGRVAQMAEQRIRNAQVAGSMPALASRFAGVAQMAEQSPCKRQVTGSKPVTGSNVRWSEVRKHRVRHDGFFRRR